MAKAKLDDIIEGIEFVAGGTLTEHTGYVCIRTGQVHCYSEDWDEEPEEVKDSDSYVSLPNKHDLDLGKTIVLKFANEHLPDSAERVREFFRKPGGFASFKSLLEQKRMLKRWFEFERQATEAAVRDWCKMNGIEVDG